MTKIALTSISPKHAIGTAQIDAINTWIQAGFKVISINSPDEISILKDDYPVTFVPCFRTMQGVFKAPYVPISAFIDYAKENRLEQIMLINSDICILEDVGNAWSKAADRLVFANRIDHDNNQNLKRYDHGFDVFIINQSFYHVITQSMFSMGQTWWDYWLPYVFAKNNIPIRLIRDNIFFHQVHPIQYSDADWIFMTRHFQWMENYMIGAKPQVVTNAVYNYIKHSAQWL